MDRSEQTKKNQAINLYTWGLELLSDGGHVRDADKVGWMLIENAATQGDRDAQNYLGDAYFYSYKKDEKAAFWYTKAAEQGLPEAQAMLGMLYLLGRGVTRNYAKARHYFEQALQGGELNVEAAVAQYWLGQMYKEGIGVPKDSEADYQDLYRFVPTLLHFLKRLLLNLIGQTFLLLSFYS